ncbi:hypothetical protein ABK040_010514 [Willaertia magna]
MTRSTTLTTPTSSLSILSFCFLFLTLFSTITLQQQQQISNFFPTTCNGECISIHSLTSSLSTNDFCYETLNEYKTLNYANISICISFNITTTSINNTIDISNYTIHDYFKNSNQQAYHSFYDTKYYSGLAQTNECYNTAKRFICQHFFPLCEEVGKSKRMYNLCKSSCENYYKGCNSAELIDFRCNKDLNVNGFVYEGVWKKFDTSKGVLMCTGDAHSNIVFNGFFRFMMGFCILFSLFLFF